MSRILRRFYSSAPAPIPSAVEIAERFLSEGKKRVLRQTQFLDGNQLERLAATLSRPLSQIPNSKDGEGVEIPAGWHLAYFTPSQVEGELGNDGTDRTFNPPVPYTRRMWAGGEVEWIGGEGLRTGCLVEEKTELVGAVGKRTKAGEEMVVVGVEKRFSDEEGEKVVDRRNWIFRPEITVPQTPTPKPSSIPPPDGKYTRTFFQTPVSLFRFSALTFNAHKIHYNREWCREVEGHRDIVVHGPLNLINMLDFWRDIHGKEGRRVRKIGYRNTSPVYAGERYTIVMDEEVDGRSELRLVDEGGKVGMVGTITSF